MRETTLYWQLVKSMHKTCLCYSKEKGLFCRIVSENESPDDLVYRPHGLKGSVTDVIKIPDNDFTIKIISNLGYESSACLEAVLEHKNHRLLDFDLDHLSILNKYSIKTFRVPLHEWEQLFNKIITEYRNTISPKPRNLATDYIEKLVEILNLDEIEIKGNIESKDSTIWRGEFLITLFVGFKIKELLEALQLTQPTDAVTMGLLQDLCRKYMAKLVKLDVDINDSRINQLSEILLSIHYFMNKNGYGADYFRYFKGDIKKL